MEVEQVADYTILAFFLSQAGRSNAIPVTVDAQ